MKKLVIYDPSSGVIHQIATPAPPRHKQDDHIPEGFAGLQTLQDVSGSTHRVDVGGKLRPKTAVGQQNEATAQAWRDLRSRRHTLLSRHVDTINAVRWDMMTGQQRNAWKQYRQALLDMPENTTDPANPAWPAKPGDGQ